MFKLKLISCLDKAMPNGKFEDYDEISSLTALKGETVSFQLLYTTDESYPENYVRTLSVALSGSLKEYARVREVLPVPAVTVYRGAIDDDYIFKSPSLAPDILSPVFYGGRLMAVPYDLRTLWIDIDIPKDCDIDSGDLTLSVNYTSPNPDTPGYDKDMSLSVEIINATLPDHGLIFTQWFHHDCLADYYKVEKWSDEHFRIIENFVECAAKNGINTLLTPLITPPLDNASDKRDLQLADIELADGEYRFSWDKLGRWVDICDRHGIKYFEIGHLYTQAGAKYATKACAIKDGERVRLFPKDTPCDDPEYVRFLRELLTSFIGYMKERGADKRMIFHISDEPTERDLETYMTAKAAIYDLISDYPIMDALSHYEFYESGAVKKPVVLIRHLDEFIEHGVEGLWTYTCCAPASGFSNRFLAMTQSRNRSISLPLYKFNIEGFLHWGYNFYNNSGSSDHINPFLDTSSGGAFPAGDAFSVYPGEGGEPLESIRLVSFRQGLEDLAAFRLCESLYSRDEVISALESFLGAPIQTNTYINDSAKMQALRDMINNMIKARS